MGDALGAGSTSWWDNLIVRQYSGTTPAYSLGNQESVPKGIVSTTPGALPFSAAQNPIVTSDLGAGQSQTVTFIVNATGFPETYNFFAFGNLTQNESVSNISNSVNITIITNAPPVINLTYPQNYYNYTNYTVPQFNFTVDNSAYSTCQLWGNWSGTWALNQTLNSVQVNTTTSFAGISTPGDGYYRWNVKCLDGIGDFGWGAENYTFSTFLPPTQPALVNISQTSNQSGGNITFVWNGTNHTALYKIYAGSSLSNLTYYAQTNSTNFTDTNFSGQINRFYQVSAWNPGSENFSSQYFGAHVYTLSHTANTQNWIGFPTNFSYLTNANQTLDSVTNATAFTMWNATIQQRTTCNGFSCPNFPSCTSTNCNFNLQAGEGYEVNINSSAPASVNWSGAGIVYNPVNVTLTNNATSFGLNWIAMYANTSLGNAAALLSNISDADAITRWNSTLQTSQGLVPSPFPWIPGYIGTNFPVNIQNGYEVSVNQTTNWSQV